MSWRRQGISSHGIVLVCRDYPSFSTRRVDISIEFRTFIDNYIHIILWDVITHPCRNFSGRSAELLLQLVHGWVIIFHRKLWMQLLMHALTSVSKRDPKVDIDAVLPVYEIPFWRRDHLISVMGIHLRVRWHLYIKPHPWQITRLFKFGIRNNMLSIKLALDLLSSNASHSREKIAERF